MLGSMWLWIGFTAFVLAMLAIDLGAFHRNAHEVKVKEALVWSGVWIGLALAFNATIFVYSGPGAGFEFLTGYLIEKSLSLDNIFVFLLIFSYFSVPARYQYKVLFWGVFGALAMRAAMIALGATLIKEFHWIIYGFGALLIVSGIKMALQKEQGVHPEKSPLVRLFQRFMPVTSEYHSDRFFVRLGQGARRAATPLFVTLLMVESADVVFAVDSIPAIFAITEDPFIAYTSNVFAILGLRSLYFALAGVMHKFQYLKVGLSAVLVFVGIKMVLGDIYEISATISLGAVALILAVSVVVSLLRPRTEEMHAPEAGTSWQSGGQSPPPSAIG
ncbi:MAG: TerC family protein [Chloroflexia bacterium]